MELELTTERLLLRPVTPKPPAPKVTLIEWTLFLGGSALILWTFMETNAAHAGFGMTVFYPVNYNWDLYGIGYFMGLVAFGRLALRRGNLV